MKKYITIMIFVICILCGCSKTKEITNPYFFPNVSSQVYQARFTGLPTTSANEVVLSITELQHFQNGILYELKINANEEVQDRYGIDRLNLGYFLVQEDKIYLIRGENIQEEFVTEEEIVSKGILVCQQDGKEDILGENEPGWHEYIQVDGKRREYHGYNTLVQTGYYEHFVWELGKGLIEYKSGYGAESDDIELHLLEEY